VASHPGSDPSTPTPRAQRAGSGESQNPERGTTRTTVVRVVVTVDAAKVILAAGTAVALIVGVAHGIHITIPLDPLAK
jgi:hypothetical protein